MAQDSLAVTIPASLVAGLVARVVCHPIDTCKARIQASTSQNVYKNVFDVIQRSVRTDGGRSLYQGLTAAAIGSAPAVCIYIGGFEYFRNTFLMIPVCSRYPALADFSAGMAAETLSCVIFVPVDVVKERLQIQTNGAPGAYRGALNAMQTILGQEGLRGIYKGYAATLFSFGPFSACYFLFYEWLKRHFQADGTSPSLLGSLACSAVAGAGASVITNPLDLVKLRLQVQRRASASTPGAQTYHGVLQGLSMVLRHEGWAGMFRGAGARVAFHVPNTAITFAVYEKCKSMLKAS